MERKQILSIILKYIMSGKYNSSTVPLNKLIEGHTCAREEYQSPYDRDSYNSGYMTLSEISAVDR
jgi:hypothetical protein